MTTPPLHARACLKSAGAHSVWLIERPGEAPRTLKRWPLTPVMAVKLLLGIAQPQRQEAGRRLVAEAGIAAAEVCGRWRVAWGRRPAVMLELVYVPGRSALEALADGAVSDAQRRRASGAIGEVVARFAGAGLFHRDLKATNLILTEAGTPVVSLIDTVGVRRMRRPDHETARMLERLVVLPAFMNMTIPVAVWLPLLRRALRPLAKGPRRAVLRKLRAHRPS